jgi:hypothetical protein
MGFPFTINANTYTADMFTPYGYITAFPNVMSDLATVIPAVEALAANLTVRERLSAPRTYYVRTNGSDSNAGLADTAGGAFLTIQAAINAVATKIDGNGNAVAIQVSAGTFTGGVSVTRPWVGCSSVTLQGIDTTGSTIISTTSANAITAQTGGQLSIQNIELRATTSGSSIQCILGGQVIVLGGVRWGAAAGSHNEAFLGGAIYISGTNFITGSALSHVHAYSMGFIEMISGGVTLSGTPAFSNYFAGVAMGHISIAAYTFSGAATGWRFLAHKNGQIETDNASLTFLPGSIVGVQFDGGRYFGVQGYQDYVPTIACAGSAGFATGTVTARYLLGDKTYRVCGIFTVSNAGGTPGAITVSLPATPSQYGPAKAMNISAAVPLFANVAQGLSLTIDGVADQFRGDRWQTAQAGTTAADVEHIMRCPPPHCARRGHADEMEETAPQARAHLPLHRAPGSRSSGAPRRADG